MPLYLKMSQNINETTRRYISLYNDVIFRFLQIFYRL